MKTRAYAVLDGGGVKGAALAGCLKGAGEAGLEFIGFGGTSAGAIVALLAAAGYSGDELEQITLDMDLCALLDDGGKALFEARGLIDKLQAARNFPRFASAMWSLGRVRTIVTHKGLYDGSRIHAFLIEKVRRKLPKLAGNQRITFKELAEAGCPPLRVLASDVTAFRPRVFSVEQTPEECVIDAVRASMSYPLVFRPRMNMSSFLADGGLISNLPVFLFAEEGTREVPTVAFDLVTPPSGRAADASSFVQYMGDLLTSALDAKEEIIQGLADHVIRVPVLLHKHIHAMKFDLSAEDRKELFKTGYETARRHFKQTFAGWSDATTEMTRLQSLYAMPLLIEKVLGAICTELESASSAKQMRACVMLPTGRGTRLGVYHWRMDTDPDFGLELGTDAGLTGRCYVDRTPGFADLHEAAKMPHLWKMSRDQQNRVPKDRATLLVFPIYSLQDLVGSGDIERLPVLGTLSLDTTTKIDQTGWVSRQSDGTYGLNTDVHERVQPWVDVLGKLLS